MTDRVPPESPYRVPFDGTFSVARAATSPPSDRPSRKRLGERLDELVDELASLQRVLYADDRYAVLCVFQALDAAGKDSTIRKVTSGIDASGFQVYSFRAPSPEELDHDFLWRTAKRLPERGRIGVFNRSYYEEVLVARVHQELLDAQRLPHRPPGERLWEERFESIRDHERHLARNGTVILKFWLHISLQEQARRFLRRIDRPDKNWKFSSGDVEERRHRDAYLHAYEEALNATSRPWAAWYAIPADDKPFMRVSVATILRDQLRALPLAYPEPGRKERARLAALRDELEGEL